jgi:hypothetical protein
MRYIAAILLALTTTIRAQTVEIPDLPFLHLIEVAAALDERGNEWNAKCGDTPTSPDCTAAKIGNRAAIAAFVEEAGSYVAHGDDCVAQLKARMVAFEIQAFIWNGRYAGEELTPKAIQERVYLDKVQEQLQHDVDVCKESKQKTKL